MNEATVQFDGERSDAAGSAVPPTDPSSARDDVSSDESVIALVTAEMRAHCEAAWDRVRRQHPDLRFRTAIAWSRTIAIVAAALVDCVALLERLGAIQSSLAPPLGLTTICGVLVAGAVWISLDLCSKWRSEFGDGRWTKPATYECVARDYVTRIGASRSDEIKPFADRSRNAARFIAGMPALAGTASGGALTLAKAAHWLGSASVQLILGFDVIFVVVAIVGLLLYRKWRMHRFEADVYARASLFSVACGGDFVAGRRVIAMEPVICDLKHESTTLVP